MFVTVLTAVNKFLKLSDVDKHESFIKSDLTVINRLLICYPDEFVIGETNKEI